MSGTGAPVVAAGEEKIMNVAKNVILPVNPNRKFMLSGTATHIAAEVIVSKLLRQVTGMEQRGWMELTAIHTLSQPFLGGFNFFENEKDLAKVANNNKPNETAENKNTLMDQVKDGAKESPAVLVAMYIAATAQKGFAFPSFGVRDLLLVVAAKALSRVLLANVHSKLPTTLHDGLIVHDQMMVRQKASSSIAKKAPGR